MKKNLAMRVASLVVVCTLITSCLVSSTFAKYTSSASATASTATVAKWKVNVAGTDITTGNPTVTFNLFDTTNRKDTGGINTEDDVAAGKIAPGTEGSFALKVENASEVTANISIDFTVTNDSSVPIKYAIDSENYVDSLADIQPTKVGVGETKTINVKWKWDFDPAPTNGRDTADTALGTAGTAPTVKVDATITATQVD